MKVMRFGDNMREVAVTEGDKVAVQAKLGWQVNTWAVGDLVKEMHGVSEEEIDTMMSEYESRYVMKTEKIDHVRYQAREEIAIQRLLDREGARRSPIPSRICMAWSSCPDWPVKILCPRAMDTAAKGTGKWRP